MSSADFAAAQQRLAARRRQREHEYRARLRHEHDRQAQQRIAALPYPVNRLGGAGVALWDAVKGREGTRPAFRVGQVDAELLDEELLELLKGQAGEALKYFGSHLADEYSPEILLALRAVLFKLSIWDHNASYGAALQGLRYTDARTADPARPPPRRWQKSVYGLATVGGRYAWTKWEDWLIARTSDYELPSPRVRLAERVSSLLATTHSAAAFASFLVFLTNGRYRTLLDRLLGLRLTPTSAAISREVSFEYLNRQLVWHAFTEFLLFLLPLVGISRWRRILSRAWRRVRAFFAGAPASDDDESFVGKAGELGFLPERTCAICYSDQNPAGGASEAQVMSQSATGGGGVVGSAATDITNPYQAVPCGCVYCFVCLAQKIEAEEGEGWTCLRCGDVATACKPWDGDVIVEQQPAAGGAVRPTSSGSGNGGKSVGFAALGDDEKRSLRQVSPAPEQDDKEIEVGGTSTEQSLLGSRALTESEEWARASRIVDEDEESRTSNGSEDEQSEEIDEEEDELEFDE
ncbi:acyl-CoA oxidase [Neofusicoccum parvum]|nr:acyl-CoA oxidase [Neofusicoccum parvum]